MPNIKDIQVILTDSSSSRVPISMLTNQHATAPDVTDDAGDGYAMGSLWLDTSTLALYYCSDATVGAAVWSRTGKQAPIAVVAKGDADATLAAADIYGAAGGIITSAPSVAHNLTLDVTAAILAAFGATVGTYFDFAVVNTGASTATLVAGDASTTLVGAVVIAANTSCMWRVLVTAAATISVIRIG